MGLRWHGSYPAARQACKHDNLSARSSSVSTWTHRRQQGLSQAWEHHRSLGVCKLQQVCLLQHQEKKQQTNKTTQQKPRVKKSKVELEITGNLRTVPHQGPFHSNLKNRRLIYTLKQFILQHLCFTAFAPRTICTSTPMLTHHK